MLSKTWGKIKRDTGERLSLVDHSIDVAVVFRELAGLSLIRKKLSHAAGGELDDIHLDRLAIIAGLHDIGKANLIFQNKIEPPYWPKIGHIRALDPLMGKFGNQAADAIEMDVMSGWFDTPESLSPFLLASFSHHGSPIRCGKESEADWHNAVKGWEASGGINPFDTIRDVVAGLKSAFPHAFDSDAVRAMPGSIALQHRFAGLVTLADWIASHDSFFPFDRDGATSAFASTKASEALKTIGLEISEAHEFLTATNPAFETIFEYSPYSAQKAILELPAHSENERLLILESETGSGKTEAALARFFNLFKAGEVDGMYFALPTRVAARELYDRVLKAVKNAFRDADSSPLTLLAVPGYAKVDGEEIKKKILPDGKYEKAGDGDGEKLKYWAGEMSKRFLAAPIAVGTIDQALLSALAVRHAHMRSVLLDRQFLVVDEVHASDPYMRYLLRALLSHHLGLGGHAMLLSATLGSMAREEFVAGIGKHPEPRPFDEAVKTAYPCVTNKAGKITGLKSQEGKSKTVHVELRPCLSSPEELLPDISRALSAGAKVLVVMNTVARVMALQETVEKHSSILHSALFTANGVIAPHHGRFAREDRELLDGRVTELLGKTSGPGPLLIIGTQTLEQSLDIDADLIITDICPMDVLLQRIGRLHRHKKDRPAGYEKPKVIVMTHEDQTFESLINDSGEVNGSAKKLGLGSVYADMRIIRLARDIIAKEPEFTIPDDNRYLVESATHPDQLESLEGKKWKAHGRKIEGITGAQGVMADMVTLRKIMRKDFGEELFGSLDKKAATRLGLNDIRVKFDAPVTSPFGKQIAEMVLPGYWFKGKRDPSNDNATVLSHDNDSLVFEYEGVKCRYSRHGLEKKE